MSEEIRELLVKAENRIEELENERRVIGLNTNGKTYYIKPSSIDAVEVVRWNPDAGHPCAANVYIGGDFRFSFSFNSRELLEEFLVRAGVENENDIMDHHSRSDHERLRTASDPGRGSVGD